MTKLYSVHEFTFVVNSCTWAITAFWTTFYSIAAGTLLTLEFCMQFGLIFCISSVFFLDFVLKLFALVHINIMLFIPAVEAYNRTVVLCSWRSQWTSCDLLSYHTMLFHCFFIAVY